MDENDELNYEEENESNSVSRPKRKIQTPSKETMSKVLGGAGKAGKVVLKGTLGALFIARVATHLASSGIHTVSKMGCLQTTATSLLTLAATVGMLPIAATIGLGNKLTGKNANFVSNVHGGVRMAGMLTTPAVKLLTSAVGLGSGVLAVATQKGIADRLYTASQGRISKENILNKISEMMNKEDGANNNPSRQPWINPESIEDPNEYWDAVMRNAGEDR